MKQRQEELLDREIRFVAQQLRRQVWLFNTRARSVEREKEEARRDRVLAAPVLRYIGRWNLARGLDT